MLPLLARKPYLGRLATAKIAVADITSPELSFVRLMYSQLLSYMVNVNPTLRNEGHANAASMSFTPFSYSRSYNATLLISLSCLPIPFPLILLQRIDLPPPLLNPDFHHKLSRFHAPNRGRADPAKIFSSHFALLFLLLISSFPVSLFLRLQPRLRSNPHRIPNRCSPFHVFFDLDRERESAISGKGEEGGGEVGEAGEGAAELLVQVDDIHPCGDRRACRPAAKGRC